jgi:hypothetical protein
MLRRALDIAGDFEEVSGRKDAEGCAHGTHRTHGQHELRAESPVEYSSPNGAVISRGLPVRRPFLFPVFRITILQKRVF